MAVKLEIGALVKKLADEKFGGKEPEWKKATWGDIQVGCTSDDKNWYYKSGNRIYVQLKEGTPGEKIPDCYGCDTQLKAKIQHRSEWYEDGPGPCAGSGQVKTIILPYCPSCETEPTGRGVDFV